MKVVKLIFALFLFAFTSTESYPSDASQRIIRVNSDMQLHRMKKQDIYSLRKSKVYEYRNLNIFPQQYAPDEMIFRQIDEKADWVHDAQFFIINPYLLVLTSGGNTINALLPYCGIDDVKHAENKIEVHYKDQSARNWFRYIYDYYPDSKGIVRLWFVNAIDAGFKYAHVDMSRSANIELDSPSSNSVANSIIMLHEFFHLGRQKKNNISPDNPRAKMKLKDRDKKTVIYVKLWRNRPEGVNASQDFTYVITMEP